MHSMFLSHGLHHKTCTLAGGLLASTAPQLHASGATSSLCTALAACARLPLSLFSQVLLVTCFLCWLGVLSISCAHRWLDQLKPAPHSHAHVTLQDQHVQLQQQISQLQLATHHALPQQRSQVHIAGGMLAAPAAATSSQTGTLWQEASTFKLPAAAGAGAGAGAAVGFNVASSTSRLPAHG